MFLCGIVLQKGRVMPDNGPYGINPFKNKNKKATVQTIIDKLSANFEVGGVLFADDDENNVRVASLGGITSINITKVHGKPIVTCHSINRY